MSLFDMDIKIPVWFGDFGGAISALELDPATAAFVAEVEGLLPTARFEKAFRGVLATVLEGVSDAAAGSAGGARALRRIAGQAGEEVVVAPDLAGFYNVAGQVALAVCRGEVALASGTYSRAAALAVARACAACDIALFLVLSRELSHDAELVDQLEGMGCTVDATTCDEVYDLPHLNVFNAAKMRGMDARIFPLAASYGSYPLPGLAGLLAGVYSYDLLKQIGAPGIAVVPIEDGTEAVGALRAFVERPLGAAASAPVIAATAEYPICQEFHNGETLITRAADRDAPNTPICPELAHWWRTGSVRRLGCDRLRPVDDAYWKAQCLGDVTARAVALALELDHAPGTTVLVVGR